MKEYFQKLKEQVSTFWTNLSKNQRIIFSSVAGLILLAVVIIGVISSSENFVPLFSHKLEIEDAGQIKKVLDDWRYPYKYESVSGYLKVPSKQKDEILLKLGAENKLPKSNIVDFGLFDNLPRGVTEYEKKIAFKRATEGTLVKLIESIGPIKSAKVALSLAEQKLFAPLDEPSKASIAIELKPYIKLEKKQIEGIVNLVSYYVPNCKSENVMIVDAASGIPLNTELDDKLMDSENKVERQKKIMEKYERDLQAKIFTALSKILNVDRFTCAVTVEMDFDKEEAKSTEYNYSGFDAMKRSEETVKEEFKGIGFKEGGRPGVSDNIPLYKGAENGPIEYKKEETRTNFEPNVLEKSTIKNPKIKRVTAAVNVDGMWEITENKEGKVERKFKHNTPEMIKDLEESVKRTIGFNATRADEVKVVEIKFDRDEQFRFEDRILENKRAKERMFKTTVLGVLCLAIIIIVFWELHKRWRLRKEEILRKRELAAQEQALGTKILMEAELTPEEREKLELLKHIQELSQKSPETVAALLRTWLMA